MSPGEWDADDQAHKNTPCKRKHILSYGEMLFNEKNLKKAITELHNVCVSYRVQASNPCVEDGNQCTANDSRVELESNAKF